MNPPLTLWVAIVVAVRKTAAAAFLLAVCSWRAFAEDLPVLGWLLIGCYGGLLALMTAALRQVANDFDKRSR
jgi:hypothetical protein